MKILKLPVETTVVCDCGCEFEFDASDLIQHGYFISEGFRGGRTHSRLVVDCPFCKISHTIQEKIIDHTKKGDEDGKRDN